MILFVKIQIGLKYVKISHDIKNGKYKQILKNLIKG